MEIVVKLDEHEMDSIREAIVREAAHVLASRATSDLSEHLKKIAWPESFFDKTIKEAVERQTELITKRIECIAMQKVWAEVSGQINNAIQSVKPPSE